MKTVAFYSYKGGVGRTLLVANTAQFLAMSGRRVVALDLDLEAPGLHQKLASPEVLSRAESGELVGAVDVLLEALEGEPQNRSLRDVAVEVDLPTGITGSLHLIPAGSAPSHAYWTALERLNGSSRPTGATAASWKLSSSSRPALQRSSPPTSCSSIPAQESRSWEDSPRLSWRTASSA